MSIQLKVAKTTMRIHVEIILVIYDVIEIFNL